MLDQNRGKGKRPKCCWLLLWRQKVTHNQCPCQGSSAGCTQRCCAVTPKWRQLHCHQAQCMPTIDAVRLASPAADAHGCRPHRSARVPFRRHGTIATANARHLPHAISSPVRQKAELRRRRQLLRCILQMIKELLCKQERLT